MTHYRAYLIGRDSHLIKAVDFNCDDDEAAKKRAERMVDGHDVELWEHARRIANSQARDNSSANCPAIRVVPTSRGARRSALRWRGLRREPQWPRRANDRTPVARVARRAGALASIGNKSPGHGIVYA
jgi:hypothetical protein